jgi:hypothetical protein
MRPCAPLLAAILAGAAAAGPLNTSHLPADSGWFIHLDVDAINASVVGRTFLEASAGTAFDASLDEVQREIGLDPRLDIHGATIYGDGDHEDDVTVLLVTTAKVDAILAQAAAEPTHRQVDADGHVVHVWDGDQATSVYVGPGPTPDQRIVVLSEKRGRVVDAINVIHGRRANLRQAVSALGPRHGALPQAGSLAFLYARGLPWLEADEDLPTSAIAQRSDRLVIDASESGAATTVALTVSAKTTKDARDIADILRGLVGLGRLLSSDVPELADVSGLLEAIAIASEGNDISASIAADSKAIGRGLAILSSQVD